MASPARSWPGRRSRSPGPAIGGVFNLGQREHRQRPVLTQGLRHRNALSSGSRTARAASACSGSSSSGKGVYGKHSAADRRGARRSGREPRPRPAPGSWGGTLAEGLAFPHSSIRGILRSAVEFEHAGREPERRPSWMGRTRPRFSPRPATSSPWYSPYDSTDPVPRMQVDRSDSTQGPFAEVYSGRNRGSSHLTPSCCLSTSRRASSESALKFKSLTICFKAAGGSDHRDEARFRPGGRPRQQSLVHRMTFVHSSPAPACYDVAPPTPTVVTGSLYLDLDIQFYSSPFATWFSTRCARDSEPEARHN